MRPVDGRSPALEHDDFGRRVAAKDPYLILFRLAGVNHGLQLRLRFDELLPG